MPGESSGPPIRHVPLEEELERSFRIEGRPVPSPDRSGIVIESMIVPYEHGRFGSTPKAFASDVARDLKAVDAKFGSLFEEKRPY